MTKSLSLFACQVGFSSHKNVLHIFQSSFKALFLHKATFEIMRCDWVLHDAKIFTLQNMSWQKKLWRACFENVENNMQTNRSSQFMFTWSALKWKKHNLYNLLAAISNFSSSIPATFIARLYEFIRRSYFMCYGCSHESHIQNTTSMQATK